MSQQAKNADLHIAVLCEMARMKGLGQPITFAEALRRVTMATITPNLTSDTSPQKETQMNPLLNATTHRAMPPWNQFIAVNLRHRPDAMGTCSCGATQITMYELVMHQCPDVKIEQKLDYPDPSGNSVRL